MKSNSLDPGQHPFDLLADSYDDDFTGTTIGKLLRGRTHERLAEVFTAGDRILEINCGTGEDAVYLAGLGIQVLATDGSMEMISKSMDKVNRLGLEDRITIQHCRFEELESILNQDDVFDGVVSNFGGLNCAEDLETLAAVLARHVKTGGKIFFCVMGRWTPWEWIYLGIKGKFSRIRQRIRGTCIWRGQTIRYYTPGQFFQSFKQFFDFSSVCGLGILLPPTYAGAIVTRYPMFFSWLDRIENRLQSMRVISYLSDHFMLVLTRK